MEIKSRTLNSIQSSFFQFLQRQNSPLTDFSQGSVLYTLGRALAAGHLEQDLLLAEAATNFYIASATGLQLDKLAANYGISRRPGSNATGYVLGSTPTGSYNVSTDTIFTEPKTSLQFIVDASDVFFSSVVGSGTRNVISETRITISSLLQGSEYNLKAGTRLIVPSLPNVSFVIGSHRTTAGVICGDLTGGSAPESDAQLRRRIIDTLLNSRATTDSALKSIFLSNELVTWATLATPLPGYVEVWVDSPIILGPFELTKLRKLASDNVAAGVISDVRQATRQSIDINIYASPTSTTDLDSLRDDIVSTVQNYLLYLPLGASFKRDDLLAELQALSTLIMVSILQPETDITPLTETSILRASNIFITFDVA